MASWTARTAEEGRPVPWACADPLPVDSCSRCRPLPAAGIVVQGAAGFGNIESLFVDPNNGDYHLNTATDFARNNSTEFDYGHSLAFIFDASDQWSIGLRGEHLSGNTNFRTDPDSAGAQYGALATGTITVRYKPVEYLVISLEGRGEWSKRPVYFSRDAIVDATTGALVANRKNNYAAILGVTAHIGN